MKNNLQTFFFLLLQAAATATYAQGDHQFQFDLHNQITGWTPGPGSIWFGWGFTQSNAFISTPFIIKWDAANDSLHWKTTVPTLKNELLRDVALHPASDGGVYAGVVGDGCDYPTPEALARLDATGNLIWAVETPNDLRDNARVWIICRREPTIIGSAAARASRARGCWWLRNRRVANSGGNHSA